MDDLIEIEGKPIINNRRGIRITYFQRVTNPLSPWYNLLRLHMYAVDILFTLMSLPLPVAVSM